MATFPAYMVLMQAGFSERVRPGAIRTEMDSGPPKQAPRESAALVQRNVTYRASSRTDHTAFVTWWRDTIARTGWFDWTDPMTSTTKQARIVGGDIGEARPIDAAAEVWERSFQLETLEA